MYSDLGGFFPSSVNVTIYMIVFNMVIMSLLFYKKNYTCLGRQWGTIYTNVLQKVWLPDSRYCSRTHEHFWDEIYVDAKL